MRYGIEGTGSLQWSRFERKERSDCGDAPSTSVEAITSDTAGAPRTLAEATTHQSSSPNAIKPRLVLVN